jgi:hypothetical protein
MSFGDEVALREDAFVGGDAMDGEFACIGDVSSSSSWKPKDPQVVCLA